MPNFKCKKCHNIFSSSVDKKISKCPRCGSLTSSQMSKGDVISEQHRTKENFDYSKQNFQCVDCNNNFQLYVNHPRHAKVCTRCRSTNLKPMSPIAYVHHPSKNKKAHKFTKFITNWNENYERLKKSLDELTYINDIYNLHSKEELEAIKKEMLSKFTEYRDTKLGLRG